MGGRRRDGCRRTSGCEADHPDQQDAQAWRLARYGHRGNLATWTSGPGSSQPTKGRLSSMRTLLIFSVFGALLPAASLPVPQTPTDKAWLILQQGLANKRAEKRANAVRALRLLPNNPKALEMAESALTDPNPKVRAAAAKALGPMGAVSSVPKLKAALVDKEPVVVLAAAHSLFLLGDRRDSYEIDYEMLVG